MFERSCLLGGARAITIAENTGGPETVSNQWYGQSFTTVAGSPASNIAFNFFSDFPATTPAAVGDGFLYSIEYLGTPSNLGSGTGFLGQATASGGFYTFDPSLTLLPSTQYFFYENASSAFGLTGGNIYAGGHVYFANSASNNFNPTQPLSLNFRVTGTPTSVPDSGASALLLGLSFTVIFIQRAFGWRQQRVLT